MPFAALLLFAACNTEKKTVPTESSSELVGNWIEVMYANPQIIQGVTLKADGSANSIGMKTLLYERWQQIGDTLILSGKSVGNGQTLAFDDTLDIVRLTEDTLVVGKYGNYQRVYYRTDKVEAVDVVDSLKLIPDGGPVVWHRPIKERCRQHRAQELNTPLPSIIRSIVATECFRLL